MSFALNKAICLHAQADDLKFLNPVRNRMVKLLDSNFQGFSFGDQSSQAAARLGLERTAGSFVVIFAHGGSDYIRGGEYVHRVTREIIAAEKFLTAHDANIFRGKVVFCLSCESNGLAKTSLVAGARAFVGFNDVPFNRYDANGNPITNHEFQQHTQQLIADAIKATIERFVSGRATLDESVAFLRLWICHDVVRFVRKFQSLKQRREIAALLLRVKDGVRYHGEHDVRFVK
jgi:hypothetical protein